MSHSAVVDHEVVRDTAPRSPAQPPADAKAKTRSVEAEAPAGERVRNVGGRLMA
jgi:hypothetical protein